MNNCVERLTHLCLIGLLLTLTPSAGEDNSDEPYGLTVIDVGPYLIRVNWTDPIPIQSFEVIAEPDGGIGRGSRGTTSSAIGHITTTHEYDFDFLSPYTNYTLTVRPLTSDPIAKREKTARAATLEYSPEKVSNVRVLLSYNYITLQWSEPRKPNGIIQKYLVSVTTDVIVYNATVNGSVKEITVRDGIKPYTNYTVHIAARTSYGWGDTYSKEVATPVTNPSGTPTNFRHSDDVTSYSVELYWDEVPADQRNGEIEGYRLRYADRGKQHEVYTESREYRLDNLIQGTTYTFYLSGYVVDNSGSRLLGAEASLELTTPLSESVPLISDQLRNDWLVEQFTTSSQITFLLTGNVLEIFPLGNGNITQYQILVLAKDRNEEFRESGYTENMTEPLTWTQAKRKSFSEPYAIASPQSSPKSWLTISSNKRGTPIPTEITIGTESCDSWTQYCNGPLRAHTSYCIYARGWTENDFYTDSDCLVVEKTKYNPTVLIIGIIVTVVVLSLVLGVVFFCLRKRKKADGPPVKPRPRKDATPLPKTPVQKEGRETYDSIESCDIRSSYVDLENSYCYPEDVSTGRTSREQNGYILDASTVQE